MVVVIGGVIVNELTEVSCFFLRYFMMQRSMYALGYPFLTSMLLIFMNSLCMAFMCWRFYKPGQVIQTQDFFFGGVE